MLVNTIDTKRILYDYILNKIEKSNLIKIAAASLKFLGPEGLLKLNLTEPWPPETLRQSITLLRLCKYLPTILQYAINRQPFIKRVKST